MRPIYYLILPSHFFPRTQIQWNSLPLFPFGLKSRFKIVFVFLLVRIKQLIQDSDIYQFNCRLNI